MPCSIAPQCLQVANPSLKDLLSSSIKNSSDIPLPTDPATDLCPSAGDLLALSGILQESLAVLEGFEIEDDSVLDDIMDTLPDQVETPEQ